MQCVHIQLISYFTALRRKGVITSMIRHRLFYVGITIFILLIILFIAIFLSNKNGQYKYAYSFYGTILKVTNIGFVTIEYPSSTLNFDPSTQLQIVLYNWGGNILWKVALPNAPIGSNRMFGVSSNGRLLVCAIQISFNRSAIYKWQNGKLIYSITIYNAGDFLSNDYSLYNYTNTNIAY